MMKQRLLITALCATVMAASAAIAAPKKGGTLTIGINEEVQSTEVADKHDDNTQSMLHHVMEGLVAYREDMSIGPMLAEKYAVSDDGRTYTFTLRQGLKFHNGAPVSSADVKWTWDLYSNPKRGWGEHCREFFDGSAKVSTVPSQITSITTPDERTVVFKLEGASATFLPYMSSNFCVAGIIHKDSLNADGTWKMAIGTGPYKVKEWKKGEYMELTRFEGYVPRPEARSGFAGGKIAYFDTLRFVPIKDPVAQRQALATGKVDFIIDLPFSAYADYRKEKKVVTYAAQRPAIQMLIVQNDDPILNDVRVRQAVAHAIDRDRLMKETVGSSFKSNPSIVPVGFPQHTNVHDQALTYDPEKAKSLLAEAGYKGQPVKIMSRQQFDNPFMWLNAQSVTKMLKEVGINASIDERDFAGHDASLYKNDYQLNAAGWSTRTDPTQWYAVVVGKKLDRKSAMWQDMEAISWAYQAAVTPDDLKRQELYDRLHQKMLQQVPLIPLYNAPVIAASTSRIKGYDAWPMGLSRFWGVWRE